MARIRTIKPEFFVSAQVADVPPTCRLLFVGMWLFCDDHGIHPASPKQLKMEVFPGDDITVSQISDMVEDLIRVGLIVEYRVDESPQAPTYWQVTGWSHQKIDRPRYQYPEPNSSSILRCTADTSTNSRSLTRPDPTRPDPTRPNTCTPAGVRYSAEFLEWWEHWPKKVQKEKAHKAWRSAAKRVGPERLLEAVKLYAQSDQANGDRQFVPYPATWLNAGSYDDDPSEWQVTDGNGRHTESNQELLADILGGDTDG